MITGIVNLIKNAQNDRNGRKYNILNILSYKADLFWEKYIISIAFVRWNR